MAVEVHLLAVEGTLLLQAAQGVAQSLELRSPALPTQTLLPDVLESSERIRQSGHVRRAGGDDAAETNDDGCLADTLVIMLRIWLWVWDALRTPRCSRRRRQRTIFLFFSSRLRVLSAASDALRRIL